MFCSLNTHPGQYTIYPVDAAHCVLSGLSCVTYAIRHWELSSDPATSSAAFWGHRVVAVIEFVPLIGGLAALIEWIICTLLFREGDRLDSTKLPPAPSLKNEEEPYDVDLSQDISTPEPNRSEAETNRPNWTEKENEERRQITICYLEGMRKNGGIGLFEIDLMLEVSPTTKDIKYTEIALDEAGHPKDEERCARMLSFVDALFFNDNARTHWFAASPVFNNILLVFDSLGLPNSRIDMLKERASRAGLEFVLVTPKGTNNLQTDPYTCGLWTTAFVSFIQLEIIPNWNSSEAKDGEAVLKAFRDWFKGKYQNIEGYRQAQLDILRSFKWA